MPQGYQRQIRTKNNEYPSSKDLREGDITLRQLNGKLWLYTKNNGCLYKTEMYKDVPNTKATPRDLARKNIHNVSENLSNNRFCLNSSGAITLANTSKYYIGGLTGTVDEANNTSIASGNYQASLFILPYRAVIREFRLVYDYKTSALNGATLHHYLKFVTLPAHLEASALSTTALMTINSTGGGPNIPHIYSTSSTIKDGTNELAKGSGLVLVHKRDDGSSDTMSFQATITGEYC